MIVSIEQHVEWITKALDHLRVSNIDTIETSITAEDAWVDHVNEVADATVMTDADSWYTGANIPGKSRVFMPYIGGVGAYRQICDQVAQAAYDGFVLQPELATTSA